MHNFGNIHIYSDTITIKFYDNVAEKDIAWRNDIDYTVCDDGAFSPITDLVSVAEKNYQNEIKVTYYAGSLYDANTGLGRIAVGATGCCSTTTIWNMRTMRSKCRGVAKFGKADDRLSETTKELKVVKMQNVCFVTDTIRVKVDKSINPTKLKIEDRIYDAGAEIEVCAEKSYRLFPENTTDNLIYTYKNVTASNDEEWLAYSNKGVNISFPIKGMTYKVLRQAQVNKKCVGKIDTFFFKTYQKFNLPLVAKSKAGKDSYSNEGIRNSFSSYCKGDGDTITFTLNESAMTKGGSGEYYYEVRPCKADSIVFATGEFVNTFSLNFPEVTESFYYVRVIDKNCPAYTSKSIGNKGQEVSGLSFDKVIDIDDFSNLVYTDGAGGKDIRDLKLGKGETDWEVTISDNIGVAWKYVVSDVTFGEKTSVAPACPKASVTENTVTIKADETDKSLVLHRWAFLDNCKTQCHSSFTVPFHCSNGWGNIDQFTVTLKTDGAEKKTSFVGCDGSTVTVIADIEDLPKAKGGLYYDTKNYSDIADDITYQWQQKIGNSYWLNIEGATKPTVDVEINSNEVKYVRCVITYNGDKLTSYNTVTVYSNKTIGNVQLSSYSSTYRTVCKNDEVKTLYIGGTSYSKTTTNGKSNFDYVWEYSFDKEEWTVLDDDMDKNFFVSVTNNYYTYFYAKSIDRETYIRRGMRFSGCDTTVYSYNFTIKLNDAVNRYPMHDRNGNSYVKLISNPIISDVSGSLDFLVNYQVDADKSRYTWGATTEEKNKYVVDSVNSVHLSSIKDWGYSYYKKGLHTATIQKEHIGGCVSAIDTFTYELFEQMSIKHFNDSIFNYNLCNGDKIKNIAMMLHGGDYRDSIIPDVKWYVKVSNYEGQFGSATYYLSTDSMKTESRGKSFVHTLYGLKPSRDMKIWAEITSGRYPMKVVSDTITIKVASDVKSSKLEYGGSICYNTLPTITETGKSSGGNGSLKYVWQRRYEDSDVWENLTNEGGENYLGVPSESLKQSAWYKRTVLSECITSDDIVPSTEKDAHYSASDSVLVIVKKPTTTDANDVIIGMKNKTLVFPANKEVVFNYSQSHPVATQGAYFVIKDDSERLVDTLRVRENEKETITNKLSASDGVKVEEGEYVYTLTKYNKVDNCPSVSDTFTVAVINGGRIEFENLTKVGDNVYWMCRYDSVGLIRNVNRSEKLNRFNWKMYDEIGQTISDNVSNIQINTDYVDINKTNVAGRFRGDDYSTKERLFKFVRNGFYDDTSDPVASDTLYLYVAGNLWKQTLTEGITPQYAEVCDGVDRVNFEVVLDSAALADKSFGALHFFSGNGQGDSNGKSFTTYWESAEGIGQEGIKDEFWTRIDGSENKNTRFDRKQVLEVTDIAKGETSYRFVMDDGCTKNYTYSSITTLGYDSIGTFIFEKYDEQAKKFVGTEYIEIGDSVRVVYKHTMGSSPRVNWYDSEECDSCRVYSDNAKDYQNHFTIGSVKENTELYMSLNIQGAMSGDFCEGKRFRVPLEVHTLSNGGIIVANESKVCRGGDFSIINSYQNANGGDGVVEYCWQYSLDLEKNAWSSIDNSNNVYLEADLLNDVAKNKDSFYISRKATNRSGRSVYSNVVRLEKYEEFVMFVSVI